MKTRLLYVFLLISFICKSQSFELFDFNNSGDFEPKFFTEYNNMLIFQARDADGIELWKTDGTQAGTEKIKDINTTGNSAPKFFTEFNGELYFVAASNNTTPGELWKTDGTEVGTVLVSQIYPEGLLTVSNNLLFFVANNGANGRELWKSDGTQSGTVMVKDIRPGNFSSLNFNSQLFAFNNLLFFSADNGTNGKELWTSDGTEVGTKMIKDIKGGIDGSNPQHFIEYKSKVYFAASDFQNGNELWKTDGTSTGTELVENNRAGEFSSNPSKFIIYSESLFFQAESDDNKGIEMHRYNLTTNAVQRVVDIYDGEGNGGFSPALEYNNGLYFTAFKPETGTELFVRRNGSTILSENIAPGTTSSSPSAFCKCGDKMYFRAYDGNESALFEFDTTGNATKIKPPSVVNEPFFTSTSTELFCYNSNLYFAANYTNSGYDLWKYSNTTLSTKNFIIPNNFISIYPNPAKSIINLKSNTDKVINNIEMYNVLGKKVLSKKNNQQNISLDISGFSKGVYLLKINMEGSIQTQKIIIQ